jgi:hypothetical protein
MRFGAMELIKFGLGIFFIACSAISGIMLMVGGILCLFNYGISNEYWTWTSIGIIPGILIITWVVVSTHFKDKQGKLQ